MSTPETDQQPVQEFKIERITTEFVQEEDRIRLNVEDGSQQRTTLWLTQRLLNRVVPALVKVLEEETAGNPQASDLQEFTQQRAQRNIEQEAPVSAAETAWLVTRVDLTPNSKAITLVFGDGAKQRARLEVPRTALRQWLSILRELYQRAEWAPDKWPDWLAPLSQTTETKEKQLH